MTVPAAPTESGGDKILFIVYDNGGSNAAALMRAIAQGTLNSEPVGHLAVATHEASNSEPVAAIGGFDGSTPRAIIVDPLGRPILRPLGAYDNGGSIAFAHPRSLGVISIDSEDVAHLGIGTHEQAASVGGTDPVVVIAGVEGGSALALAADPNGRLLTDHYPTFGGSGHKNIASTGTAVAIGSSLAVRKVRVKADADNSNIMYVGTSAVTRDETESTGGFRLAAGQEVEIEVSNRNLVYINGTSGEGVQYLYWT